MLVSLCKRKKFQYIKYSLKNKSPSSPSFSSHINNLINGLYIFKPFFKKSIHKCIHMCILLVSIKLVLLVFSQWVVSDSCDPMDYSPTGSSVHGVSQARILEWIAISFSKRSFWIRPSWRLYPRRSCIVEAQECTVWQIKLAERVSRANINEWTLHFCSCNYLIMWSVVIL